VVVLLTESASLTSRETLTVLGGVGIRADVVSSGRWTISQFSRWRRRSLRLPAVGRDPAGFVQALGRATIDGGYQALLPTHEQAWLLAVGRSLLPVGIPVALAEAEAFEQVQSKVAFARLLDLLGLPQPQWWLPGRPPARAGEAWWVKAAFGTAGRGVRRVTCAGDEVVAVRALTAGGLEVICQADAPGQYGQVQAVFQHGQLLGVHCSVKVGEGAGGSAAARLSVDHPEAVEAVSALGRNLCWHGGLTLDYFHVDGHPQFIEGNPRTVEPGNAAAAGVNLPALTIAVSRNQHCGPRVLTGRPGVLTHSSLALALGAAAARRSRRAVLQAMTAQGGPLSAAEVLTPVLRDRSSTIPYLVATTQALLAPTRVQRLAGDAIDAYAITPTVIHSLRQSLT
jgi:hypothetical protein